MKNLINKFKKSQFGFSVLIGSLIIILSCIGLNNQPSVKLSEADFTANEKAETCINLGVAYFLNKKFNQALREFKKLWELSPNNPNAYHGIAVCLNSLERYEESLVWSLTAIRLDSKNAAFYNNAGASYYYLEKYIEALENYNKAIALDKNFGLAYVNQGVAYYKIKEYSKSAQAFKNVIEINTDKKQDAIMWLYCALPFNLAEEINTIRINGKLSSAMKLKKAIKLLADEKKFLQDYIIMADFINELSFLSEKLKKIDEEGTEKMTLERLNQKLLTASVYLWLVGNNNY